MFIFKIVKCSYKELPPQNSNNQLSNGPVLISHPKVYQITQEIATGRELDEEVYPGSLF